MLNAENGNQNTFSLTANLPIAGLVIRSEVATQTHSFTFRGFRVEVAFPSTNPYEDVDRFEHGSWSRAPYFLQDPERTLEMPAFMVVKVMESIPPHVLVQGAEDNPNWWEVIDGSELRRQNVRYQEAAEQAFEYWLRVIRWVMGSSKVGRIGHTYSVRRWAAPLHNEATGEAVTSGYGTFVMSGHPTIDDHVWQQAKSFLQQGLEPTAGMDYYFEGRYLLWAGDYRRAVIDLAIAAESHVKTEVKRVLPSDIHTKLAREIFRLSSSKYFEELFPAVLPVDNLDAYNEIRTTLKRLADARNRVLHGATADLDAGSCRQFADAVEVLLTLEAEAAIRDTSRNGSQT